MKGGQRFFSLRSLALAAGIVVFFTNLVSSDLGGANPYYSSFQSRIGFYAEKMDSLSKILSWNRKMFLRHLANVEIPKYVVSHLSPTDTVLLPPREYAALYMQAEPTWTDPRVFVYMAGFAPIVAYNDAAKRHRANTFIVLEGASIWLAHRGGSTNVDSLLRVYDSVSVVRKSTRSVP